MLGEIELLEGRSRQVTAKVLVESRVMLISKEVVFRHSDLLERVSFFHRLVKETGFWSQLA